MKKFITSVIKIKFNTCIIFTGSVIVFLVISLFTKQIEIGAEILWQLLFMSFLLAIIQCLAFDDTVIKKLKYVYRNIIFLIPSFALLSLFAYFGSWFETMYILSWVIFAVIFLLLFIGISIGFSVYFKITGQKYNLKLEKYKAEK